MSKKTILIFAIFILAVFIVENIHSVSAFNWNDGSLVAYYKLDDSAANGGSVAEATGNYFGTNHGAMPNASGKINTAYHLDNGQYIDTGYGSGQVINAITFSAWVKMNDTDDGPIIATRQPGDITGQSYMALALGYANQSAYMNIQKLGAIAYNQTKPINDNQWHFLVGTFNNTATAIYVDGVVSINSTGSSLGSFTPSNNFYIGWDPYNTQTGRYFTGVIDEVGIWNRALTPPEVSELYNSGNGLSPAISGPQITITLNSPVDKDYNSSSLASLFGFVSGNNSIINVTLMIDGIANQTNSSGANGIGYWFYQNLTEGNHTWALQACDITGYCRTSSSRTITIDKTAPVITLNSPSDNYTSTSSSITFITNATDSSPISNIYFNWNYYGFWNSTIVTNNFFTIAGIKNNGMYQWSVTYCDIVGNCNTSSNRTLIVSIPASSGSSSGGGSSGGGGGGGGAVSVTVSQSSNGGTTVSIQANQPIVMNVNNSSTGITQVQITSNQNSSNASITVSPSNNAPTASIAGETYKSFQITLAGIDEANVVNVSIYFKINKTWMDSNGRDPANVTLFRNTGGGNFPMWQNLSTTLSSQDSENYYYQAISPGFSTYSVVVGTSSCNIGESRCLVNDLQQCASNQTWETIKTCQNGCSLNSCVGEMKNLLSIGKNVYYFGIALIVILGGVVFFVVYRHHKKSQ
jgi:PGF-pre-PGF domain-containing protein